MLKSSDKVTCNIWKLLYKRRGGGAANKDQVTNQGRADNHYGRKVTQLGNEKEQYKNSTNKLQTQTGKANGNFSRNYKP